VESTDWGDLSGVKNPAVKPLRRLPEELESLQNSL